VSRAVSRGGSSSPSVMRERTDGYSSLLEPTLRRIFSFVLKPGLFLWIARFFALATSFLYQST
jgi:hypothetical protein